MEVNLKTKVIGGGLIPLFIFVLLIAVAWISEKNS